MRRRARIPIFTHYSGFQPIHPNERTYAMLWTIVVILLILWLLGGFVFHVGSLIHLLLVIILIVVIYQLVTGRRV